jgi:hypothetical protein
LSLNARGVIEKINFSPLLRPLRLILLASPLTDTRSTMGSSVAIFLVFLAILDRMEQFALPMRKF